MNSFFARRYVVTAIFVTLCLTLLVRLFYMQIVEDKYFLASNNNVIRKLIMYPARGPILDRNGKILVQNEPVYDVTVIPHEVKDFDTLAFCKMIGIDKDGFDKRFSKALKYSPYRTSIFEKQLPATLYASLQEKLSEFPGFYVQPRTIRTYPDSIAAHFLGYIGEVTDRDIEKSHGYYHPGDYIGRTGVEKAYEDLLRGQRGVRNVMVDSRNVSKGRFANGTYDTVAIAGKRLMSSLDSKIQKLGEKLMNHKVGSIVAIEPSTGEILAFVSSPGYDPNLMVGRERGNNIAKMYEDPYNPLMIRPIQAYYPPGSSFKPLAALIALQEGLITPQTGFECTGIYWAGNHPMHCDERHGYTNLSHGIAESCNTYFCNVFTDVMNRNGSKNIGATYTDWREKVNKFGFGVKLDVDLPNEKKGFVPTALYYDNKFHQNRWHSTSIISLAIGQGELEATPLQLANIECTIANHGFYYKPHLIKSIGDSNVVKKEFTKKNYVGIDAQYFEPVIDGMQQVVEVGTAHNSKIPGIIMCGKTGTAQNPHGKNHSIFVAFAPRENPKIAIAVIVENSGQGAWWAAPIASYMVEQYLKGKIERPQQEFNRIMNANLMPDLPGAKPAIKVSPKADSLNKQKGDTSAKPPVQLKSVSRKNKTKKDSAMRVLAAVQIKRKDDEQ
jgi:penicillin-binding protein 2